MYIGLLGSTVSDSLLYLSRVGFSTMDSTSICIAAGPSRAVFCVLMSLSWTTDAATQQELLIC